MVEHWTADQMVESLNPCGGVIFAIIRNFYLLNAGCTHVVLRSGLVALARQTDVRVRNLTERVAVIIRLALLAVLALSVVLAVVADTSRHET